MKRINFLLGIMVAALVVFNACQKESVTDAPKDDAGFYVNENDNFIEGQYIVVLNEGAVLKSAETDYNLRADDMQKEATRILRENNFEKAEIVNTFNTVYNGFTVKLDKGFIAKLKLDKRVKYIEQDRFVSLGKPSGVGKPPKEEPSAQEIPWGIQRVGGPSNGVGKTAWIIDTGIDLDHPDLNVDVARSVDFTGSRKGADDENGHGTHVAGTIAAIDNTEGVVGVAAGATVVAVRVLDRRGSGALSGVIAGVDYVAANASSGDVANMSLGGGVSTSIDDAVYAASSSCKFALAAGNESDDANNHSPARVNGPNIYTISAMDINDNWAYFSNYGNPPVDYCAPGVNINSTWKEGGYNVISGTSMACPHAAGVLLMGSARTSGYVNGDPDGNADPVISQ